MVRNLGVLFGLFVLAACAAADDENPSRNQTGATPGGSTPDAAQNGATPPGTTPPPGMTPPAATTVPIFVAIGHEGRTTISCDDGKSWVANRSDDDTMKCFDPTDCDHNGKAGRGIAFADGYFVANFGWGEPGTIRRSRDGVTWEQVDSGANFASMATGNGKTVAIAGVAKVSDNDGKTWTPGSYFDIGARRGGFAANVFLIVGDGPKAATSTDGATWNAIDGFPAECAADIQWSGGIAEVNGGILVVGGDGTACFSGNGGAMWSSKKFANGVAGRLVRKGNDVFVWGQSAADSKPTMFHSTDGTTWDEHPTSLAGEANGPPIGPVAVSANGTFVAANDGWQVWYEKQRFFRSTDGIAWEALPTDKFVGSHPITHMLWAEGDPSAVCPLP